MNEKLLREYIRRLLAEAFQPPKGKWVRLEPGSPDFEEVREHLYKLIGKAYADTAPDGKGRHIKITDPGSLDRYAFWLALDHDEDPEIDVTIFGKPEYGAKSGGVGHDGSGTSASLYKQKSSELRKGGSVGGIGNWWGEVSGRAAYALLKRGAPVVSDKATVDKLLAGDKYTWHDEHPPLGHDGKPPPPMFQAVRGWYTKDFGPGGKHTKIIVGIPQA